MTCVEQVGLGLRGVTLCEMKTCFSVYFTCLTLYFSSISFSLYGSNLRK